LTPALESLVYRVRYFLRVFENERFEWWLNEALGDIEQAAQRWRAEDPSRRPSGGRRGRRKVINGDVQLLLKLRAANPDSDCRREFEAALCLGEHGWPVSQPRAYIRYKAAAAMIALMPVAMAR
jgi:hypothetical protein